MCCRRQERVISLNAVKAGSLSQCHLNEPCCSLAHSKYETAKTNPTANYLQSTEHDCQQRYKHVYYRAGCDAFWVHSRPIENKLSNSGKKLLYRTIRPNLFPIRNLNVYMSSSLTLSSTVTSLTKVVYAGECTNVITIHIYIYISPLKSYSIQSILGYIRFPTTHHHRLSSYRCPGTQRITKITP
jgi:hypothetical protein